MRRFRVVTLSVLVIVLSSALMGLLAESPNKRPKETALVAAHESAAKEKVSPWMLIGFFKECIKRNRTNKRKEYAIMIDRIIWIAVAAVVTVGVVIWIGKAAESKDEKADAEADDANNR